MMGMMMMMHQVALETLEGHQRAIMGSMTVEVDFHSATILLLMAFDQTF